MKRIIGLLIMLTMFLIPIQVKAGTRINMGEFKITYYCPCEICSEGWGHRTSSGKTARSEHTIAVDPEVIDIGSRVLINGIVFTAEDTGGGVKGDHIDIFVDSHEETIKKGVQHTNIWVVRGKEYGE